MNSSMSLKKSKEDSEKDKKKRPLISLLIPFKTDHGIREETFKWLIEYWKHELPDAEIVVGHSHGKSFHKTQALNDAVRRSHGKVLVILDADAYLYGRTVQRCADRIMEEIERGFPLWYIPYRHLYRLTREATLRILKSDPEDPLRLPNPPDEDDVIGGQQSTYGHRYGAMVMIFPREALEVLGCFDERFKGWGGEDVALLRALDTLYGKHKTIDTDVLHLWHPTIGSTYKTRMWEGQKAAHPNDVLASRYNKATKKPLEMRALVNEGCNKHGWIERFLEWIRDLLGL